MRITQRCYLFATFLTLTCFLYPSESLQQEKLPVFAGQYQELLAPQKILVDDWFRRFSETIHKPVSADEGYNNLPMSVKTTFNAVTHALIRTKMTDNSGANLEESAIGIIDKVDNVAGKMPGTGGDKQFRIYVQLKPGALDLLDRSQEFKRGLDNTIYHKGYPICYRSTGGTPSIQVSATRDKTRADIDVDYRSSKFPVFLINGHLSSSNSDVRAGNNLDRHNNRWSGLQNWWRNLLGLSMIESHGSYEGAEEIIPPAPKVTSKEKPYMAVYDFLNTWLVEQKPNEAMSYFSEEAYKCIEVERGQPVDQGMAKFLLLESMQNVNKRIGPVASLSEAVQGIRLSGQRGKVIEQPYHSNFVFYDVREDLAALFDCAAKLDAGATSAKALHSERFGKYYGALFNLKDVKEVGIPIATIWAKEGNYWKLVSYDIDPKTEDYKVPDLTSKPEVPTLKIVEGDQEMIRASRGFLEDWFVQGRTKSAFAYLAPQSYACFNVYRSEDSPAAQSDEEAGDAIQRAIEKIHNAVGKVKDLRDAIVATVPSHEDIQIVRHDRSKEYVIASLPDYMGEGAECSQLSRGEDPGFVRPQNLVYGNYYAAGFRLAESMEDSGALWIVWHKEEGKWKVVSFLMLTP